MGIEAVTYADNYNFGKQLVQPVKGLSITQRSYSQPYPAPPERDLNKTTAEF